MHRDATTAVDLAFGMASLSGWGAAAPRLPAARLQLLLRD